MTIKGTLKFQINVGILIVVGLIVEVMRCLICSYLQMKDDKINE